ncbi:TPA: 30S ribosomal protein S15 [Candidatus Bathyarchaeota archaeon]|nr:30S ribosomal protein S15 [Candidatus Bathyarchaeota archaeon]
MARLYARKRGKSDSTRPVSKRPPAWCKYTPEEIETLIVKLGREGHAPSVIGNILRDQHGVPLVKPLLGKSITQVLKEANLAPSIPEDLNALLKKAERVRRHLEKNKKDYHNKRALALIESKIHRLGKHYLRDGVLPADWKYKPAIATVA